MAIIKCPECGHQVSDQAKTCPSCGIEILGKIMPCPECGEIVFKNQRSCPCCNAPLHGGEAVPCGGESVGVDEGPTAMEMESQTPAANSGAAGPASHRRPVTTVVAVAFVLALLVVFGWMYFYKNTQEQNELDAYENAMASGEPAVLKNFLDMYVDAPSEHRDSVSARLADLKAIDSEWADAVASGSKTAIERYVKMHPNSVHVAEAKIKVDSLDWVAAADANTSEAYRDYIERHADGLYVDEAQSRFEKLDAQKVTPEDEQAINSLFSGYFTSLAAGDEEGLTACLANIMTSFLHKENATKADVIEHMKRINSQPDVTLMNFRLNNDMRITKSEASAGGYEYSVTFSLDQKLEYTDAAKNAFNTYKVEAKVSPDMKIEELNMRKVVL